MKKNQEKKEEQRKEEEAKGKARHVQVLPSHVFFQHNTALGPPYHVLLDTNFINKSFQNKLDIVPALMDCLFSKCKYLFVFFECYVFWHLWLIRHSLYYGLRDGRVGKAWQQVSVGATVG